MPENSQECPTTSSLYRKWKLHLESIIPRNPSEAKSEWGYVFYKQPNCLETWDVTIMFDNIWSQWMTLIKDPLDQTTSIQNLQRVPQRICIQPWVTLCWKWISEEEQIQKLTESDYKNSKGLRHLAVFWFSDLILLSD